MNAQELLTAASGFTGAQAAGAGEGVEESILVNKLQLARTAPADDKRLAGVWKRRRGPGATPLVLVADEQAGEGFVRALGPQREHPIRRVKADALYGVVQRAATMKPLAAVRYVAEELGRLDTERVAGLRVEGLGTEHLFATRLPESARWPDLAALGERANRAGWKECLTSLGYRLERLEHQGHVARHDDRPIVVVHARAEAWGFSRLDERGRLPEGALLAATREQGAPFGILASGTRLRLFAMGAEDAGAATRYLELDLAALEPDRRPLLGLMSPAYLADGGFDALLAEARDYGQELRKRLDLALRQQVLPALGLGLGRWAAAQGRDLDDDELRDDLEAAALLFVFRALFLLYAESAGYLPMANPTYHEKSLTAVAHRAHNEREAASDRSTALWDDVAALVKRMRTGNPAWELPAYNGELFAPDIVAGAETLEAAELADAALGPALVALARDPENPDVGADFSGLEVGHLGYVYEGLLSLRLSVADRDYRYDAGSDRYVAPAAGEDADVAAGELLWLTNEGGRKSGGVYYTRTDIVRHLVRGAVRPAFERHVEQVRELAERDPAAAGERLFDFAVIDPACGSAHFLVEVVDELADRMAALLGEVALPTVAGQLEALRRQAAEFGAGIEDAQLLKRLVLKRCVYGVDLSPLGAEIAKMSLWLGTFVPGLSLAYLDHNVQCGNSLIGVARASEIIEAGGLLSDTLASQIGEAATAAAALRAIDDTSPEQVAASRVADAQMRERIAGARRLFDLWTAEPLGLSGARQEVLVAGREILDGQVTVLAARAEAFASQERVLHWPLAFPEVFDRERPGFDAVVGNPPWEEITVEELAFYARYSPGLRGLPEGLRAGALTELLDGRPELADQLTGEQERLAGLRSYFAVADGYSGSVGDPDVYKLFSQRYGRLVRDAGAIGVVLPRSAFAAKGSGPFREWLLRAAPQQRVDFLLNKARWAFDMEPRYSVALLVARLGDHDAAIEVAGVADSATAFARQVAAPGLVLRPEALGSEFEIPLLHDQASADLLARMRALEPFPFGGGRWRCFPVREFDEATDKALWRDATAGRELWKGASFDQFDPTGSDARPCPASDAALVKQGKPQPGKESLIAAATTRDQRRAALRRTIAGARVAFRDVTRATDSRTVRASLVPSDTFLTNTAPYLVFIGDDRSAEAACLAVMNSLAFDWQARRFVEIHLNFFVLEGLKAPTLTDDDFDAIATGAARLSCPDERFADFAAATGVEVGRLGDDERDALRADIDARVARSWGLDTPDLETIFADFTLAAVPEPYRDRVRARFAELT